MTLPMIIAAVSAVLVMAIGGLTTSVGRWYQELRKPSWNPPNWVFGPAWGIILGLAAWAAVEGWEAAPDPASGFRILGLFGLNIVFHLMWSPLFFTLRRPDWALMEVPFLWASILALIVEMAPYAPRAGWLLLPYLLWVSFATLLNYTIVRMNAPFAASARNSA